MALCAMKSVEPDVEFLTALGKAERSVVGDIVALPHEGVDGAEGFALAARQNEEGIVKILGGRARDAAADRVRHDELAWSGRPGDGNLLGAGAHFALLFVPSNFPMAARATNASLRGLEMAGRFPRTA